MPLLARAHARALVQTRARLVTILLKIESLRASKKPFKIEGP